MSERVFFIDGQIAAASDFPVFSRRRMWTCRCRIWDKEPGFWYGEQSTFAWLDLKRIRSGKRRSNSNGKLNSKINKISLLVDIRVAKPWTRDHHHRCYRRWNARRKPKIKRAHLFYFIWCVCVCVDAPSLSRLEIRRVPPETAAKAITLFILFYAMSLDISHQPEHTHEILPPQKKEKKKRKTVYSNSYVLNSRERTNWTVWWATRWWRRLKMNVWFGRLFDRNW